MVLANPERTLRDSRAIEALFISLNLIDRDNQFSIETWIRTCKRQIGLAEDRYQEFLTDYQNCEYLVTIDDPIGLATLNVPAINNHLPYLKQTQLAKLRKDRLGLESFTALEDSFSKFWNANETVRLELTIDCEFGLFSDEEKARVLKTLKQLLDLQKEINVNSIKEGSTKLTLTLSREQAEQLLWLYECGSLDDLNIKDAKIIASATATAIVRHKVQSNSYDVFMCHNSEDKLEVRRIAMRLRSHGILPWLDEWELRPGLPWQQTLEEQIENIKSAAIFVGNSEIGPWQNMELNAFIRQFVQRQCPVIPVVLKTCGYCWRTPIIVPNSLNISSKK